MANWYNTRSDNKACRIDLDEVVAVVERHDGHVEVFLRGGKSLTVEGKIDDFAPLRDFTRPQFAG
jgi:hypothetical protein